MTGSFRESEIWKNHNQLVDGKIFHFLIQNAEFPLSQAI